MNFKKCILILAGEPNSIFFEIFFKSIEKVKSKYPMVVIGSINILKLQMKELKFKKKIRVLDEKYLNSYNLDNEFINLIDIDYSSNKAFGRITNKLNIYIKECFKMAFKIIKKNKIKKLITGPINKKTFLDKKFLGITEYISKKFKKKNSVMLIYNEKLSVCPLTTHLPLKRVSKMISKNEIIEKVDLVNKFYKNSLNISPKIAVLGLNPHCESVDKFNEDEKIILPAVKYLKKKRYNIYGPISADTIFLKNNRNKFDIIIGMYHDQVLGPIKTLFEYDAINVTLGLPFQRVSPDHGPNENMLGKNISNPLSLIKAIKFLNKID